MAPLIYPEPTWSNRFGRFVRTLQVVAVAGAIGAVGGGVAVMTLVGNGNSPRQPTVLKASTSDNGSAIPAGPVAPQPDAAAVAVVAPAAVPPPPASADPSPQQSPATAEPSSTAAATEQHPVQEAAEPAGSSPGADIYNRVEPDQKAAPAHARVRPKATHRIKNAERRREQSAPSPAEPDARSGDYGFRYSSAQRRGQYGGDRTRYSNDRGGSYYSGERYSYRDYAPPPVMRGPPPAGGFFFGGGGYYDRGGGWGN